MAEIIKQAPEKTYDVVCTGAGNGQGGCGSTIRYKQSELRYFPRTEKTFNIVSEAVVCKCPSCGQTTDLESDLWPEAPERKLIKWTSNWRNDDKL